MKVLLITTLLTISSLSYSACELTVSKKKAKAKTSYVAGVSVSAKIQEALSTQCTIKTVVMTPEQVKEMNIKALEKRLAKLKTK